MVRLTGRGSTSSSEEDETIEVVTRQMATGQAAAGQLTRTSSSNTIGSGATTPSSNGSRRRPSLVFAADDDSGSDSLTGPSGGPRRRCSIVSSEDGLSDIMDLRRAVDGSDHGSKSAYDLSVCSGSSFETMRTEDALEKVGMFEVALSSSFKKAEAEAAKKNDNVEHSDHSSDDERKPVGLINVMLARSRRGTMETIWSARKTRETAKRSPQSDSILIHSSLVKNPDDDSISKKLTLEESKSSRRKAHIRRCAQAAIIFVALSMFVASAIYLAMEDAVDPLSRSFSSFATKTEHLLDMVFGSSSEEEEVQLQQEGLAEPSVVQAEVAEEERRHDARIRKREENMRRREEENRLRRERVAEKRQARIDAQEDKRRALLQEQRVNENLRGGGGVNPEVQEHVLPKDLQPRRKALLHTFAPIN